MFTENISKANTFVRPRAYRIFLTSEVRINLRNTPQGLRHPSEDTFPIGRKILYAPLYCYIAKPLCSRSVSKIDLRYQWKCKWDMNFWGKIYEKKKIQKIYLRTFFTDVRILGMFWWKKVNWYLISFFNLFIIPYCSFLLFLKSTFCVLSYYFNWNKNWCKQQISLNYLLYYGK